MPRLVFVSGTYGQQLSVFGIRVYQQISIPIWYRYWSVY